MALVSRTVETRKMSDGTTVTLTINYDSVLLTVLSITTTNPSKYTVKPHLWQAPGNVNQLGDVLTGITSTLGLSGLGIILLSDLTLPNPWEIGLGVAG
jgi:hypothetical protein